MKIQLLFRPPENRTEDHWLKLWSSYHSRELASTVVELYVYRLLPYILAGSLIAHLTLALVLFVWISRKPHPDVGYWDVVLMPLDWEGFQHKRGRLQIESGQQDIRNGKFQEGVLKIRIGLNKYPEDREARVFLAQIYYMAGLVDPAHDLMQKGIELGIHDVDFLSSFFNLCHEADAFQSALDAAEIVLGDPDFNRDPDTIHFINRQKVTSLIELGKLDAAYEIAHAINSDPDSTRRMVDAEYLILKKSGKLVEALTLLEKWKFRMNPGNVQLQNLFIDAYIALKDDAKVSQSIRELINFDRLDPDLRLLALKKWHKAGKMRELENEFTSYMLLFAWDPENLRKVNNFVTSIREIPLIEQVLNYSRKRGMKEDVILFNLFYAYLMDGRWEEANGVLDLLKGVLESFSETDQKLVGVGETIVRLKREQRDNLRLLLLQELRRLRASITFYLTVSAILRESDLHEVALDTLEQGLAIFPDSPRMEEAYAEAAKHAVEFAKQNTIEEVVEELELGPDEYLLQLDQFMADGKYEETEDLLTRIYRVGAPWLSGRGEDFEYRKLQLYFETRDSQTQSQSTTLFLSSNPDRGPELYQLALSYLDKGKTEQSRILAEEIVRKNPRNREARKLLQELGENSSSDNQSPDSPAIETGEMSEAKVISDLQAALADQDWKRVETLIQSIIRTNPAWLAKDRQEFDLLHIRYYLESGNLPSASSLIRIFMGSDALSARRLLNLAKDYRNQGLDTETDFLIDQVNRKFPNMKP